MVTKAEKYSRSSEYFLKFLPHITYNVTSTILKANSAICYL